MFLALGVNDAMTVEWNCLNFLLMFSIFCNKSLGFIGCSYPRITNKGLCYYTDECERMKDSEFKPVMVDRGIVRKIDSKPLYLKDTGMVPHYTGHVPGKFYI